MQLHISRGHALACVLLITFMFAGCTQGVKEYWKTSKRYYYEYINTPAEVDLELEEKLPAGVEAIGVADVADEGVEVVDAADVADDAETSEGE